MDERMISAVDADGISSLLREMGWPATPAGNEAVPRIVSSANGVNFNVCFGTKATSEKGWTDLTISARFSFDQEISPVVVPFWNRRHRFARVYRTDTQLFLDMDVVVSGGVSRAHLKHQFAVWADIARMFLRHLRADQAVLARYNAAGNGAAARPVVDTAGTNGPAGAPGTPPPDRRSTGERTEPADRAMRDANDEGCEQDIEPG